MRLPWPFPFRYEQLSEGIRQSGALPLFSFTAWRVRIDE